MYNYKKVILNMILIEDERSTLVEENKMDALSLMTLTNLISLWDDNYFNQYLDFLTRTHKSFDIFYATFHKNFKNMYCIEDEYGNMHGNLDIIFSNILSSSTANKFNYILKFIFDNYKNGFSEDELIDKYNL
jgi:hypothetical protein